ncbi:MAG TPA: bis(5'-nucleosyl)-tetraphosphatase (symmetrical) YqeK [Vampirovibrionales bacterium]
MKYSLSEIKDILKQRLSEKRYTHTLGVAKTAQKLAQQFHANTVKAEIAGILHDCAKEYQAKDLLQIAIDNNLELDPVDKQTPHILHARVGALVAQNEFGLEDKETLEAIKHHTLGKPNMNTLEEILFLADAIEPSRKTEWSGPIKKCLEIDGINKAIAQACKQTISEVLSKSRPIHHLTVATYNFYLNN